MYDGRCSALHHAVRTSYLHQNIGEPLTSRHRFAGNGAAQALEDTAVLKALFQQLKTSEQIPALLAAFDQIRRPRSQKVVEISRQFGRINMMLDPPDHNLDEIRRICGEGAAYCSNIDIEAQNQEAVRAFEAGC